MDPCGPKRIVRPWQTIDMTWNPECWGVWGCICQPVPDVGWHVSVPPCSGGVMAKRLLKEIKADHGDKVGIVFHVHPCYRDFRLVSYLPIE